MLLFEYFEDKNGSYVLEMWLQSVEGCKSEGCSCESNGGGAKETGFVGQEVRQI